MTGQLPPPSACPTCEGTRVDSLTWAVQNDRWSLHTNPCRDCCCPVCGEVTGGGMCEEHGAADFVADDTRQRRLDGAR